MRVRLTRPSRDASAVAVSGVRLTRRSRDAGAVAVSGVRLTCRSRDADAVAVSGVRLTRRSRDADAVAADGGVRFSLLVSGDSTRDMAVLPRVENQSLNAHQPRISRDVTVNNRRHIPL